MSKGENAMINVFILHNLKCDSGMYLLLLAMVAHKIHVFTLIYRCSVSIELSLKNIHFLYIITSIECKCMRNMYNSRSKRSTQFVLL